MIDAFAATTKGKKGEELVPLDACDPRDESEMGNEKSSATRTPVCERKPYANDKPKKKGNHYRDGTFRGNHYELKKSQDLMAKHLANEKPTSTESRIEKDLRDKKRSKGFLEKITILRVLGGGLKNGGKRVH